MLMCEFLLYLLTQAYNPCRTLVNRILTAKHGYRVAVIMNEYGESAGIERAIVNDAKALPSRVCALLC